MTIVARLPGNIRNGLTRPDKAAGAQDHRRGAVGEFPGCLQQVKLLPGQPYFNTLRASPAAITGTVSLAAPTDRAARARTQQRATVLESDQYGLAGAHRSTRTAIWIRWEGMTIRDDWDGFWPLGEFYGPANCLDKACGASEESNHCCFSAVSSGLRGKWRKIRRIPMSVVTLGNLSIYPGGGPPAGSRNSDDPHPFAHANGSHAFRSPRGSVTRSIAAFVPLIGVGEKASNHRRGDGDAVVLVADVRRLTLVAGCCRGDDATQLPVLVQDGAAGVAVQSVDLAEDNASADVFDLAVSGVVFLVPEPDDMDSVTTPRIGASDFNHVGLSDPGANEAEIAFAVNGDHAPDPELVPLVPELDLQFGAVGFAVGAGQDEAVAVPEMADDRSRRERLRIGDLAIDRSPTVRRLFDCSEGLVRCRGDVGVWRACKAGRRNCPDEYHRDPAHAVQSAMRSAALQRNLSETGSLNKKKGGVT